MAIEGEAPSLEKDILDLRGEEAEGRLELCGGALWKPG